MKRATLDDKRRGALAERLNIPLPCAIGLIEGLLHYTGDRAPQGDIGAETDAGIAHGRSGRVRR